MRISSVSLSPVKSNFTSTAQVVNNQTQPEKQLTSNSSPAKTVLKTTGLSLGGLVLAGLAAYGIAYKSAGIISNKKIEQMAKGIGKELADFSLNTGENITVAKVREVLISKLGKKKADKVVVAEDYETFADFAKKEFNMDAFQIWQLDMGSISCVVPGAKSGNVLLYLKNKEMSASESLNTVSHEIEHVITRLVSPEAFNDKILIKLMGQKKFDKYIKKYAAKMNDVNIQLQQELLSMLGLDEAACGLTMYKPNKDGLLQQLKCNTIDEVHGNITNIVNDLELSKKTKENKIIVKTITKGLQDEVRAYKTGSYTERYYTNEIARRNGKPENENALVSEMRAMLFQEAVNVLKNMYK